MLMALTVKARAVGKDFALSTAQFYTKESLVID